MGKIKKLLETELIGGNEQTEVYPVTSTKAVYDENNRLLDTVLLDTESNSKHARRVFKEDALYYSVLGNGQGGTKEELNSIFKAIYVSKKINGLYLSSYMSNRFEFKDSDSNTYSIPASMDQSQDYNITTRNIFTGDILFIIIYNPSKRVNAGFVNSTFEKTGLSDDIYLDLPEKLADDIIPLNYINKAYDITSTKIEKGINNWIGSNGGQASIMPSARIWGVPVRPNTKYFIRMSVPTEGATVRKGYAFYSSNTISSDTFISGSDNYPGSDININVEVTTPSNCSMIAFSGYNNKDNFEIYRYASVNEDEFLKVKDDTSKNSQDISTINKTVSDIIGYENKPLDLVWEKGYTDLQGQKVLGGSWGNFISTTSVFLDDYDKLSFTLTNVNFTLPAGQGVTLLLTKEGEDPIKISYAEVSIICSNYKGYVAHFNQRTKDAKPPIIYATKGSILSEGGSIDSNEIVCVGDSLTNNYPTKLQEYAVGYSVKKCQMGSETSIANLCRMGGLQFVNSAPITIPASGATDPFPIAARWVTDLNKYANLVFANIDQPSTTLNGVIVNGIKGSFKKVTSSVKGLVIFNSSDSVIKTFDTIAEVELSTLSDVSYCKITINNPYINEPHLLLDDEPQDVDSLCTQNGYIRSDGNFVSDESFKCSDKIMLTGKSRIYADGLAASKGYVFTRKDEGSEIKLGSYNIFTAGNYTKYKNSIHIIFTGQNGGYDNEEDLVAQIKTSVSHLKKYIVVSTWGARTTEKLNKLMIAAFGNKYVNLREYMINQSVLDAIRLGLVDAGSDVNNWQSLFIGDGTHPNGNGNILWARLFWNTLLDLGFVEGDRA